MNIYSHNSVSFEICLYIIKLCKQILEETECSALKCYFKHLQALWHLCKVERETVKAVSLKGFLLIYCSLDCTLFVRPFA